MRTLRFVLFLLLAALPLSLQAEVSPKNVPASAVWYFHADFEQMRSGGAGKSLFDWLDGEVFEELRDEIGVDLSKEANQVTAYAAPENGVVVVVDGSISQKSKDKILAMAVLGGEMEPLEASGKEYYYVAQDDADDDPDNDQVDEMDFDSFDDATYFSFSLKNKIIVTSSQDKMKSLLASNGRITAPSSQEGQGALFVLSADRGLMQAGINTDKFGYETDWDSNILRNARQVALLIADDSGKLAIEAQLVTTKPEMASSLASVVRGLISLQVFNDDMEPEISELLQSTNVDVEGSSLRLRIAVDPDLVIATILD